MRHGYRIVEDMASGLSHYLADQDLPHYRRERDDRLANDNIGPGGRPHRSYIAHPRLIQEKCVAISPATAVIVAMEWMNTAAHRMAIRKNASVVCRAVINCPVARIDLGEYQI